MVAPAPASAPMPLPPDGARAEAGLDDRDGNVRAGNVRDGAVRDGAVRDAARRAVLHRRIRLLVRTTIGYNAVEALVGIVSGVTASSVALVAFGLDSVVEVCSAAAIAWQFAGNDPRTREKKALRLVAVSFFALAAYVTGQAVAGLAGVAEARHSTVGLGLAALSLAVMPLLSGAQRRAARELGSRSALADSRQTLLCTYLSAVLLAGLVLNDLLGWAWADPVAALVIAVVAAKEGRDAWRADLCCAPLGPPVTGSVNAATDGSGDGCSDGGCCRG